MMIQKSCPYCESLHPCQVVRSDWIRGYHEWECSHCAGRWVVRMDEVGQVFWTWDAIGDAKPLPR
jgi:hypothetical protein